MASWYWTGIATSALGALLLAGCSTKPPLPSYGPVSNFTLTDQTGASFDSSASLGQKIWVADFFFTSCPGPCPRMSSQMHQVQTAFAGNDNVRFVSFTVDPANDTPPVLAAYAKHFEAIPGKWFFLTGPVPELNRLSRATFNLGNVDGSLEHSTRFVLIDATSQIRGYYQTSEKDAISNLIADVKSLLKEQI
jgi:protein SCO1/2